MRVSGLFGWVRHNNARSAAIFAAFALLSQPMAMVVLFAPLTFVDLAHAPWYNWSGYAARYAPIVVLAAAIYFLIQMRRHVDGVRKDLDVAIVTRRDEPRLCGLIEPLAMALGIEMPAVGVIESQAMNAFACGVTRKSSALVFTRGLINGLDDDELASVIAHELIHIVNGDTRLIAAANIFMRTLTLQDAANIFKPKRYRQVAVLLFAPVLFPVYVVVAMLARLFVRFGNASRLLISSAREFVADAEAIRLTQDPAALVTALRRIENNFIILGLPPEQDAMMIAGAVHGRLATHPPIMDRIKAIVAVTGTIALEARQRRDTREDYHREKAARRDAKAVRDASAGNDARDLARIALMSTAPEMSGLKAFFSVGDSGELNVFGLRWDIAAAMLATFIAAGLMRQGDMMGFFNRMSHALDRPDKKTQTILDKVIACRGAQLGHWIGFGDPKATEEACGVTSDFVSAALGRQLLNDGSMVTESELMMMSPVAVQRINAMPKSSSPGFQPIARRPDGTTVIAPIPDPPLIDLAPSYPLPLHEAWLKLARDDLRHFVHHHHCGVLVHVHMYGETDRSVVWSITSEGEERIRFTATLEPIGENTTRVQLRIDDRQPRQKIYEVDKTKPPELVVFRPALSVPLRTHFAEEMTAALEDRLFFVDGLFNKTAFLPGDGMTGGVCMSQRQRLEGEYKRYSIHDTGDWN